MPTIETNSSPTCLDGICVHCAPRPHIFVVLMCQANKPTQSKKHGFPVPLPGYPSFPGHMSWRFLKGIGPCHHHPIWQFGSGLLELLPLWWNFLSMSCCPSIQVVPEQQWVFHPISSCFLHTGRTTTQLVGCPFSPYLEVICIWCQNL